MNCHFQRDSPILGGEISYLKLISLLYFNTYLLVTAGVADGESSTNIGVIILAVVVILLVAVIVVLLAAYLWHRKNKLIWSV